MLLADVFALFERHLFPTPSTDILFNPYRDRHHALDLPDAPVIRQQNLQRYLASYVQRPSVLILAEAPGPWGCRFSGVPLVSEAQLADPRFPIDGQPTSTVDTPHHEYSARIYWRVLRPFFPHFFTWNTVPFHPHQPGEPLTIRTPRIGEIRDSLIVLEGLLDLLRPQCVLAIGRKAEGALGMLGVDCTYVRHPSQGGAKLFAEGVEAALCDMGFAAK